MMDLDFIFLSLLFYFLFYFLFLSFFFFILDLSKRYNIILYMMVTQVTKHDTCHSHMSHNHVTQKKVVEGSGISNII